MFKTVCGWVIRGVFLPSITLEIRALSTNLFGNGNVGNGRCHLPLQFLKRQASQISFPQRSLPIIRASPTWWQWVVALQTGHVVERSGAQAFLEIEICYHLHHLLWKDNGVVTGKYLTEFSTAMIRSLEITRSYPANKPSSPEHPLWWEEKQSGDGLLLNKIMNRFWVASIFTFNEIQVNKYLGSRSHNGSPPHGPVSLHGGELCLSEVPGSPFLPSPGQQEPCNNQNWFRGAWVA